MSKKADLKAIEEFDKEYPGRKQKKGFAIMDITLQRKIASMGGNAAWAKGVAHKYNHETARIARIKQLEKKPVYKIAICQIEGCSDTYTVRGGAKYCFTHRDEYIERNSNRNRNT